MAVLLDAFDNNSFDVTKWTRTETNGTVTEQNNRLEFAVTGGPNTNVGYLESNATVDITNDWCGVQVSATSPNMRFRLALSDGTDYISLLVYTPSAWIGGYGLSYTTETGWNNGTFIGPWCRLRHTPTVWYWEQSVDGIAWTAFASIAASTVNVAPSAVTIRMGYYYNAGENYPGFVGVNNLYGPAFVTPFGHPAAFNDGGHPIIMSPSDGRPMLLSR